MTITPEKITPIDDTALLLAQSYGTAHFDYVLGSADDNDPYYRDAKALAKAGRLAIPRSEAVEVLKDIAPYLSAQARQDILRALYVTSTAHHPFQEE